MSGNNIIQPLTEAIASVQEAMQILAGGGNGDRAVFDFGASAISDRLLSPELFQGEVPLPAAYNMDASEDYDWKSYGEDRVQDVYTEDYMDKFVGVDIPGADNPQLNTLMTDLLKTEDLSSPEAIDIVKEIAGIRGIPEDQFLEQFDRYQQILHEGNGWDGSQHYAPSDYLKGDFMGSLSHLRYGAVVGDAIGLDPVFAGMMNPTGGIVGPGELGQVVDPESALSYHGIFHDAGGFLHNYLDLGPGYDYLTFDTKADNPLQGQIAGIQYWQDKMDVGFLDGAGDMVEWTSHFVGDAANYGLHEGSEYLDDKIDQLGGWTNGGLDDLGNIVGFIPGAENFFDDAGDQFENVLDHTGDFVEDLGENLGSGSEWVMDNLGVGADNVIDGAENALENVSDFASDAWETFSSF